jgi:hypothetical protein
MPAAELSRLRTQINGLIVRFAEPEDLRIALRDLLESYANRAYRAGQAVQPQPLLPSYRVSPLVIQQLELELSKTCQEQPAQAIQVVEALWHDPFLEPRVLAAHLLGAVPASQADAVIQKLREWAKPEENFRMLDHLFHHSTRTLRREAPQRLLALYGEWIGSQRPAEQGLGLRALVPVIADEVFENLPTVFRLISPLVQSAPSALHTDLQAILEALARRSPTETAYFLRQTLSLSSGPGTARLIRRCMPLFGSAQQDSLRTALKAYHSS